MGMGSFNPKCGFIENANALMEVDAEKKLGVI